MSMGCIEKVSAFFQGVANRDPELAAKHVNPEKYIEHIPHLPDGIEGIKAFVQQVSHEDHRLAVVRTIHDGAFVVAQAQGSMSGRNVFFHVFRFENGLIVEHWGFSAQAGPANKSGHTQADGPAEPKHGEDTERNKALVREYYEAVHIAGEHGKIPQYFSADECVRHEPGVADGVAAFIRDLKVLTQTRSIHEIRLLLGQGDFVFLAAKGTVEGRACVYIDLYRVEAGKLVEHWGFPEEVPAPTAWRNSNGIL
jgi:predicted SnoaL-like aldol condensation-catalyzing enzyme